MIYTSWRTTQHKGAQENLKIWENLKSAWSYSLVPSFPPKIKFFLQVNQKLNIWFLPQRVFYKNSIDSVTYLSQDCKSNVTCLNVTTPNIIVDDVIEFKNGFFRSSLYMWVQFHYVENVRNWRCNFHEKNSVTYFGNKQKKLAGFQNMHNQMF